MKKIALIISLMYASYASAQEGQFSQYFASGSLMNPAFSGTVSAVNFNTNYKQAGNKNEENYLELLQGTFTYPLRRITTREEYFGSIGVTFFRERRGFQGAYRNQKILMNGSYVLDLSEIRNQLLVFGLQGGVVQQDITSDGFEWGSQYNRYFGYDNSLSGETLASEAPIWYPIFNFGAIYTTYDNTDHNIRDYSFTAGLSADNLNRPKIGFIEGDDSKKPVLFKAFATFQFPLGARFYGHPSAYVINSNSSTQLNMGMYISTFVSSSKSKVAVEMQTGAWYRLNDSFIAMIGLKIEQIRLGFSADLNSTDLGLNEQLGGQLAAYELSLTYNFELAKSYRRISSPIF